jgi:plastocyanin
VRSILVRLLCLLLTALLPSARAADPQIVSLAIGSYYFKPDTLRVIVGQPVTLDIVNQATFVPHDLVIHAPEAGVDINVDVAAGKHASVTFTPTKVGRYDMLCDKKLPFLASHKDKGMHGILDVVEAGSDASR